MMEGHCLKIHDSLEDQGGMGHCQGTSERSLHDSLEDQGGMGHCQGTR